MLCRLAGVLYKSGGVSDPKNGISLHNSPTDKAGDTKWKRFIEIHRGNFKPDDRFVICSRHFDPSCFQRTFHMPGAKRVLKPGSIPTIWSPESSQQSETNQSRKRRQVSFLGFSGVHQRKASFGLLCFKPHIFE